MHQPEDFGYTPIRTLAQVADTTPASAHSIFWNSWQGEVFGLPTPAIEVRRPGDSDPSDPSASHQFESLRHVRIGGALFLPPKPTPVRAALVALHGYTDVPRLASEEDRWKGLCAKGVAVFCPRVRGFAGSQLDAMAAAQNPLGWITHGLDTPVAKPSEATASAMSWVLPQAVADSALACLAMSRRFGPKVPVSLFGESFGAALALIAAVQVEEHLKIERLAIGLPSLGDWPWRLRHRPGGVGCVIEQFLKLHNAQSERMIDLLRLHDSVVHAPMVRSATLCKLAERDDVVPAPTSAAAFNAIGTDPGLKWRFVVPFGHFDGGIKNARKHAEFDRAVDSFLDPAWDPVYGSEPWEARPPPASP